MKIYQVGGSVRDALLGLPVEDRDFVVVGATPEAMIAEGFKPVGRDFPVFLHPRTHEEYALARTERKSGRGHQGFVFHASPEVSLESDLERRDLTINAMARDDAGNLIDPYHGQRDLADRILRHVSPAFAEDPLRVLRVARFAARFGFVVADETLALMRALVQSGELRHLSPERVWREFALGLVAPRPSRMLTVLRACGALHELVPELDALFTRESAGVQPDLGIVTAHALDAGSAANGALVPQHAIASRHLTADAASAMAQRLRAPIDCRDAAVNAVRFASTLERAKSLAATDWLALLTGLDAMRRPERLTWLATCLRAYADVSGCPETDVDEIEALASSALRELKSVDYKEIAGAESGDVKAHILRARLDALERWLVRNQAR